MSSQNMVKILNFVLSIGEHYLGALDKNPKYPLNSINALFAC
jgi:hypothetical protein